MNQEHRYASILRAIAEGKQIEQTYEDERAWLPRTTSYVLTAIAQEACTAEFRVAPDTIEINGHRVPKPYKGEMVEGQEYWIADPVSRALCCMSWRDGHVDRALLGRGLVHLTKKAAEAHTKALLSFTEEPA